MKEPDIVLADIIQSRLGLDDDRVVIYDQDFKAPKDKLIYIVISTGTDKIISNINKFDESANEQVQTITMNTTFNVEITSKNEDAKTRRFEVLMAINSNEAIRESEDNNIRIFRTKTIQDLSFIEGGSSLHRFRIPVIISHMIIKRSSTNYYDSFQSVEVGIDG